MLLEQTVEPETSEDALERPSKKIIATAVGLMYGSFTVAGFGGYLASSEKYPTPIRVVGGIMMPAAPISWFASCYYSTPKSERANWADAHPFIPKRLVNYLRSL